MEPAGCWYGMSVGATAVRASANGTSTLSDNAVLFTRLQVLEPTAPNYVSHESAAHCLKLVVTGLV